MGIYKRPKRKNYEKLKVVEEQLHKITQLKCKVELLRERVNQLNEKNMRLRLMNSRYTGLFAVFMCKCMRSAESLGKDSKETLNEIYSLSRKMLEGVK